MLIGRAVPSSARKPPFPRPANKRPLSVGSLAVWITARCGVARDSRWQIARLSLFILLSCRRRQHNTQAPKQQQHRSQSNFKNSL